ncbi:MAG: prepilin peptidase [Gemmataceae bacterium]
MIYVWLVLVFILGLAVGSFLNVCISRLPLEKSVLWPMGSRCGHCLQAIRWYDNIPLLSYFLLRGRCRTCGTSFSMRYPIIELFTGLSFAGLFYLEVVVNVHHWSLLQGEQLAIQRGVIAWQAWVLFGFHAILFSFLLAAAACDLEHREIPLSLTVTGTVIGLLGAVLFPWPWPYTLSSAGQTILLNRPWWQLPPHLSPPMGLYPWPVWGPLPDWLPPGSWQLGLATGLAGMFMGTWLVRIIGGIFTQGLGKEAIGLGDADLMMMAGAFLGWQLVVVAFFLAVIPGLFCAIAQLVLHGDRTLPFGPALALGVVMTWLGWHWIAPRVQPLFFFEYLLLFMVIASAVFLFLSAVMLRKMRGSEEEA